MTTPIDASDLPWQPTWAQAVSDFRGEDDEPPFDDVTVRMTVPASIGGRRVRVELSNVHGDDPVLVGRAAVGVDGRSVEVTFDGQPATHLPVGGSTWTDPVDLVVEHGDDVVVDLYLPEPTPYTTAGGFRFDRSLAGDHVGRYPFPLEGTTPQDVDEAREFPAANTGTVVEPDGTGWSLPAGGPFLRTIEVAGTPASAVVVALGGSSTAMGWPQEAAAQLPAEAQVAVVNRGISGNRIRVDAPPGHPSWGRSGLSRFDDDVLSTSGATHLVVAFNSNDWGVPGRVDATAPMPTVPQLIDGYAELVARAEDAGLRVLLATVTPLSPELLADPDRERIRLELNEWIRSSGRCVDFDAEIRSATDPSRLEPAYAAPDSTHPNVNGEKRLARALLVALELAADGSDS